MSPINENFVATTTSYTADADHDATSITFTATAATGATYSPDPATFDLSSTNPGGTFNADIVVTAEDGTTTSTYRVVVTKDDAPPTAETRILFISKDKSDTLTSEELAIKEGTTSSVDDTTYWVSLWTNPDTTVTVTVAAIGDGGDLTVEAGNSLTFTSDNWDEPQRVALTANEDDDAETDAVIELMHTAADVEGTDSDYHDHADTLDVTITENDSKGVNMTATGKEIMEGTDGTYSISLRSQPVGGNVTIEVTGAPSGVTVTNQLVFNSTNWRDPQDVTVNRAADNERTSHSPFNLGHGVLGGGYSRLSIDDVGVQIVEARDTAVIVTTTAVTLDEDSSFTYTIALTQTPSAGETVTVDLNFNTGDFGATATTVTFNDGDTTEDITITAKSVTADAVKTISYSVSVTDTSPDDQVYDDEDGYTATSTTVTVKNVPE
ncbi:MAG: cadherin-like beta sandwich domain-containing protein [Gemmatimonadota bacterium]|nr:cadherin-like beta sandwich domain-containing protein [Gemmatimonadota bacterium]